jgi:Zn-dependent peptidase ImmA (M78 family)/DNA-binding XRE family transcriptional regulator
MSMFNPEMFILARESRGKTQTELASEIPVQQGSISKIEAGINAPSEATVQRIAEVLDYPIEFFSQADRVYGFNSSVFFHRKRQALPDKILRKLHAFMNLARMRVARLLRAAPIEPEFPLRRIELAEYDNDPEQVARLVRSAWMMPTGPIRSMADAIENAGGVIVRMEFGTRQADALSEWVPGYPPIFLVNSDAGVPPDRLRMTLAHEMAHVILHRFPGPEMEDQANTFAAELLMPRKQIKASLYNLTLAKLIQLKRIWKVSMAALIQRAHDLKTITDTQRRYLFMNMAKKGYRTQEPPEADIPAERPTLLTRLTSLHLRDLEYSSIELKKLLFISDDDEFRSTYAGTGTLRLVG